MVEQEDVIEVAIESHLSDICILHSPKENISIKNCIVLFNTVEEKKYFKLLDLNLNLDSVSIHTLQIHEVEVIVR